MTRLYLCCNIHSQLCVIMFNIIKNNILVNYGILLVEMPVSVYELNGER